MAISPINYNDRHRENRGSKKISDDKCIGYLKNAERNLGLALSSRRIVSMETRTEITNMINKIPGWIKKVGVGL